MKVFFQENTFLICFWKHLFQIKAFYKKNVFQTKKFYFHKNVHIFKAFHPTLVKQIFRIESAGKGAAMEKSKAVTSGKRINERASFVYNL